MFLQVGSTVRDNEGREYVLDNIIGEGGFGYVFKAHRTTDRAVFAVKTTFPSFINLSSASTFQNEIRSAVKIRGENVVRYEFVHDGAKFPDFPPYIIMEYANGGTLRSFLEERRQKNVQLEIPEMVRCFKQLARGMEEINKVLVHRDIKPENILLCGNIWKISDFGLSKTAEERTRSKTFKGWGTTLYMAPEAWNYGKNTIQMDIYAMGIAFYELATLHYPYAPIPHSVEECRDAHLLKAVERAEHFNPKLAPNLISIINRMLAKRSGERFANWSEILQLLDQQTEPISDVDKIVWSAIAYKNAEDANRQKSESAALQRKKEKSDFCKLIFSQAENEIEFIFAEFAEKYNAQYGGQEKITILPKRYSEERFSWEMRFSDDKGITIDIEAILKDNFQRELPPNPFAGEYDELHMGYRKPRTENYIPQYRKRNILAWGRVVNRKEHGFNILLLDSDELYGEWLIMQNKNNLSLFSPGKERKEPFAFKLDELQKEITSIDVTHSYRSEFTAFDKRSFIELIQQLIFFC